MWQAVARTQVESSGEVHSGTAVKKLRYFYLNGHLHRVIHVNRGKDLVTAYDFIDHKMKVYPWSDTKRMKQNAFTVTEAAELLGRHRDRIKTWLRNGDIERPQQEYSLKTGEPRRYFFSEDDMMELRDFMSSIHIGRPRKDGRVTNNRLPTRDEFRAMIQTGRMLYVKENDEFVPVWRAEEW
jgi:hypothetical protein